MNYYLVDVFSPHPFSGNSLTVFPDSMLSLEVNHFLRITREMHHFESIFLTRAGSRIYSARVFDLLHELTFAGHPVIGASCVLHWLHGDEQNERWSIQLPAKTVDVVTCRRDSHYYAELNQGRPEFFDIVPKNTALADIVAALNLKTSHLHPDLPPQVVSTG